MSQPRPESDIERGVWVDLAAVAILTIVTAWLSVRFEWMETLFAWTRPSEQFQLDELVPVLLMLAGEDRIIDNGRTRRYLERFATADKTIIEYPEAHHTLEFEPDPTPVFADLTRWVLDRSQT